MKPGPAGLEPSANLHPGETVLWTGPATFPPANHSIPFLICFGLVVLVFYATWVSTSASECDGTVSCAVFYWSLPFILLILSGSLLFDKVERLVVSAGRARVRIILTDRRLIRVADWPWYRVRAADYRVNPPHSVAPGVLQHGRYLTFALSPNDAESVMDLINRQLATIR